jgi:hypothetical protein
MTDMVGVTGKSLAESLRSTTPGLGLPVAVQIVPSELFIWWGWRPKSGGEKRPNLAHEFLLFAAQCVCHILCAQTAIFSEQTM